MATNVTSLVIFQGFLLLKPKSTDFAIFPIQRVQFETKTLATQRASFNFNFEEIHLYRQDSPTVIAETTCAIGNVMKKIHDHIRSIYSTATNTSLKIRLPRSTFMRRSLGTHDCKQVRHTLAQIIHLQN